MVEADLGDELEGVQRADAGHGEQVHSPAQAMEGRLDLKVRLVGSASS
jgi:hypothetical protein